MAIPTQTTSVSQTQSPIYFDSADEAVQVLRRIITGAVLLPGDEGYDAGRQIRQASEDRLPALIVQPANSADVAQAVRFARDFGLVLSVRSGGHSFAGHSVNDGGMVIDMRNLNRVTVDAEKRTAHAQAGATSAMLGAEAQKYGLALSTGDTASVALGGLTLGGGIGWMVRKQGLTIDNLLSARMVTADGEVVRASADENSDLFWALRGGGGNFGVVTEFEYRLHEVGTVFAGLVGLPPTPEVLRRYADWAVSAPDEMTTITFLMQAPPAPFVPAERAGQLSFIVMFCYLGDPAEGKSVLAGLREAGTAWFEVAAPMPYPAIYDFTEEGTHPSRETVRSLFLDDMPDSVIEDVLDAMAKASPMSMMQLRTVGGAMARVPADATAFANRTQPYLLAIVGSWPEGSNGAAESAWALDAFERVGPHGRGAYVNFLQHDTDRIGDAYPEATYRRLAEVKRRYDPGNLFSQNQNVKPAV